MGTLVPTVRHVCCLPSSPYRVGGQPHGVKEGWDVGSPQHGASRHSTPSTENRTSSSTNRCSNCEVLVTWNVLLKSKCFWIETGAVTKIAVFWVIAPCSLAEVQVNFYQITRRYNPEDSRFRTHRRENLKSYWSNYRHRHLCSKGFTLAFQIRNIVRKTVCI
jgi:hypothetical protein